MQWNLVSGVAQKHHCLSKCFCHPERIVLLARYVEYPVRDRELHSNLVRRVRFDPVVRQENLGNSMSVDEMPRHCACVFH